MKNMFKRFLLMGLLFTGLFSEKGMSQTFTEQIDGMFAEVLEIGLAGSPGAHGNHFKPSNVSSSAAIISTLENFIGTSVSSFPLSSTVAGITFDFSSGIPVSTSSSLGPIFSERAQTIGKGLINLGFNFTYMNLNKIRGLPLENMRLSFTHQDVGAAGMGDSANEFDFIDFFPDLEINALVFAVFATVGITDRLDIGIAVPFVNVGIKTSPRSVMNSFTYTANDTANHFFAGSSTDPDLKVNPTAIDDDATGLGDIALRAKYNFLRGEDVDLSALVEYRLATGDADNFLGAGNSNFKVALVTSSVIGDFAPHLNVAYEVKGGDNDRDELEFVIGYDQKISSSITMAVDFVGEYEMGSQLDNLKFPDPITVAGSPYGTAQERSISLTNIPDFESDHIVNAGFGLKYSPKESIMIVGNVFVPLNDAGLRADVIPTVGFEFTF
jgi:hypothetical protein